MAKIFPNIRLHERNSRKSKNITKKTATKYITDKDKKS